MVFTPWVNRVRLKKNVYYCETRLDAAPSSCQQIEDKNDEGQYKQQVDEGSADVEAKAKKPEDD
jgi:hypothetical protein